MAKAGAQTTAFDRHLVRAYRRLGAANRGVLLAVSGGADSTALLVATSDIARRVPLRFEVACLDHGLRPEAAVELECVRSLCERLGVRFHPRALGLSPGPGIEERAREARYAALEELRVRHLLDFVATAHTANDQAETLLMRLTRGSALRGASSVLAARGRVIRPMLHVTREEVVAFLRSRAVDWSEDPMNQDARLLRTRVRRGALPALEEAAGPGTIGALARFAELAEEDDAYLQSLADAALARIRLGVSALDRVGLLALPLPLRRRVFRTWLEDQQLSIERTSMDEALEAISLGKSAPLSGRRHLASAGGEVRVVRTSASVVPPDVRLVDQEPTRDVLSSPWPGEAVEPFSVRTRRPGDRVLLPGGQTRKLQDLLIDLKIRREDRGVLPLVVDAGGRIVWVIGHWPRPGERGMTGKWLIVEPKQASR